MTPSEEKHFNRAAVWYCGFIVFVVFLMWLLTPGCASTPVAQSPQETPSPSPDIGAVLTNGWSADYTTYVAKQVPQSLLDYPPESVCPKYRSLSDAEKRLFWANWMESIAHEESGFNRLDFYYENGISDPDSVTGKQNCSEGLLQVSFGDPACKGIFDYAHDKDSFLDDYARAEAANSRKAGSGEVTSAHPDQSILNPYNNLACGLAILNGLLAGHPERSFQQWGGKYWSTIRRGDVNSYFQAHFSGSCR